MPSVQQLAGSIAYPSLSGLSTVTQIHTFPNHQVKSQPDLKWASQHSHQPLRTNSVVPCPKLFQSQDPHTRWIPFMAVSVATGAVTVLGHPPHPCSQNSTNQRKFQPTKCLKDASVYQANKKALHHENQNHIYINMTPYVLLPFCSPFVMFS